jgi:hypothetical protein
VYFFTERRVDDVVVVNPTLVLKANKMRTSDASINQIIRKANK